MKKPQRIDGMLEHTFQGEHPLRTLWFLFDSERGSVILAVLFFIVKHSPVWVLPLLTANIINVLVEHKPIGELWLNAAVLAVLVIQNVPMHYLYVRFLSRGIRAVEMRLRSAICRRLQHLSIGYFSRVNAGVLQSKVVRDVEAVEQMIRQAFDGGASALSNMAGALVITALRVPLFLPVFLLLAPVSAVLVQRLRGLLAVRNRRFREEMEHMAAQVSEMTHLIPVTRAHGLEQDELERVTHTFSRLRDSGLALDAGNALFGALAWAAFNLFNAVCLVTAAALAYTGTLPIGVGEVVMLTGYFNSLTSAIMALVGLAPVISKGFESLRSVGEVLESPDAEQNEGKPAVAAVRGAFRFEGVSFRYPETDEAAVHHLDLSVESGETIALVGPSGAGKSTMINLVIGFIRPTEGRILLDGRDMEELDLRTYRRHLSVVPQESILFEGSVRENVTYGMGAVPDSDVLRALEDANVREFVDRLDDGLDSRIGERGTHLSGGQKQRLAIARALIRNPRILLLDEATSALDSESEAQIQEALERLMRGRTSFVVAHRLSTIRNATRIVVLEAGRITEDGTHSRLLDQDGTYARLLARQLR